MRDDAGFQLGLIEGFYGRQWAWQERKACVSFLAGQGYSSYVYAPKGDQHLRSAWRDPIPETKARELGSLREVCHRSGMQFGIGISPLGYGEQDRDEQRFLEKLRGLNALRPDTLWLLFDDMRGDDASLARRQIELVEAALLESTASHFSFCPSYYSFDPKLEEVFGQMPAAYWRDLGAGLPAQVNVLWTGEKVITERYSKASLMRISEELQRKPLIWDNYPVNDGRLTSNFLHLTPAERPSCLRDSVSGWFANPANQCYLSWPPLAALAASMQGRALDLPAALKVLESAELASLLMRDIEKFQLGGLDTLRQDRTCEVLADEYRSLDHPAAKEVADWLKGEYVFDPACLTD